jgi:hypothetical protein
MRPGMSLTTVNCYVDSTSLRSAGLNASPTSSSVMLKCETHVFCSMSCPPNPNDPELTTVNDPELIRS